MMEQRGRLLAAKRSITLLLTTLFVSLLITGCSTKDVHKEEAQKLQKQKNMLEANNKKLEDELAKEKAQLEKMKQAEAQKKKEFNHSFYTHQH